LLFIDICLYVYIFTDRLTRKDGEEIAEIIKNQLAQLDPPNGAAYQLELAGSYRRGKQFMQDLDVLFTGPGIEDDDCDDKPPIIYRLQERLTACGLVQHILLHHNPSATHGSRRRSSLAHLSNQDTPTVQKLITLCRRPSNGSWCQVDLMAIPPVYWPCALLSWTGSSQFERSIRLYAKRERNIHFSGTQMIDLRTNQPIPIETEREAFQALGLEYLEPSERNS
jgi:DNA polymerase mu